MNIPVARIFVALLLLAAPIVLPAVDPIQNVVDRTLIRELMDRYGIVHDSGSPEETDHYTKQNGQWRIQRREITIEFGNRELGEQLGLGG